GHQPMANEDSTIFLVFNGEIYNHIELRPLLEGAVIVTPHRATRRQSSIFTKNMGMIASITSGACSHLPSGTYGAIDCSARVTAWGSSPSTTQRLQAGLPLLQKSKPSLSSLALRRD